MNSIYKDGWVGAYSFIYSFKLIPLSTDQFDRKLYLRKINFKKGNRIEIIIENFMIGNKSLKFFFFCIYIKIYS